jgi:hypothetical protein
MGMAGICNQVPSRNLWVFVPTLERRFDEVGSRSDKKKAGKGRD